MPEKNVKVTVAFPVTFNCLIDTDKDIYELKKQVKDEASQVTEGSSVDPIITECDDLPELID